jgi:uncharacterized cofD-like protein
MAIGKIIKNFFLSYLELPQEGTKIVCLGGGTGLSVLLSGLKYYSNKITAIVTMCDEGGSSGRLRRTLGVPPVGDLRNCLAALSYASPTMTKLLNYRFAGERYGKDTELGGHSFGNLLLVALSDITGDFNKGLQEASKILNVSGQVLPSTAENVRIWAETTDGQRVYGEEKIDLGKYDGKREIKKLYLSPSGVSGFKPSILAIKKADMICVGPGDLYTSIMPNLLVKEIKVAISASLAKKILIVNVANKPFETPNYKASDYLMALKNHCGENLFNYIILNTNHTQGLVKYPGYHYVENDYKNLKKLKKLKIITGDFVDRNYPLHHDPDKLAKVIISII